MSGVMLYYISTHTLTWSVTRCILPYVIPPKISTHTLTWSVTEYVQVPLEHLKISTHTLTWSVTSKGERITSTAEFQLTRSRGAWPCTAILLFFFKYISTHTLTWSVTSYPKAERTCYQNFNSHAHVERDRLTTPKNSVTIISTHTLTWSVTTWEKKEAWHKIFQLTRSRGAWLRCTSLSDLHELFQLTRSRGAWRYKLISSQEYPNFNSHAHVERDFSEVFRQ